MFHANIIFHLWFKVCKPVKRKYGISTNCTLVLNGAYLLSVTNNNRSFTLRRLRDYCTYYNPVKIKSYISILIDKGFITLAGVQKTRQYYNISDVGLQVIEELNESYSKVLYEFCSQYNIEL